MVKPMHNISQVDNTISIFGLSNISSNGKLVYMYNSELASGIHKSFG